MSLEGAAELGTRLDALKELRKILARAIDETESKRDLASLSNRFTDVCAQIDEIESKQPSESTVDSFEAKIFAINGGNG